MTTWLPLTVTFANIPSDASKANIQHGFNVASAGTDILFTAEDHMRRSADFMPSRFMTLQTIGHQTGRCSIHLDRARFKFISDANPLLNAANGMRFPGAKRFGKTARVQDRWTGRWWNLGAYHLVPHADDDKHPGVITSMPRGRANVLPAIASIIKVMPPRLVGQELWGADVNIDLDNDLRIHDNGMVEQFNKAGFRSDVQALGPRPDTHGRQEYDWLMGRFSGAVKWHHHSTLPKLPGLDHRFPRAVILSTVRKGHKAPAVAKGHFVRAA